MKKINSKLVSVSILWAAAILASALIGAPNFLTVILLPVLAYMSIMQLEQPAKCSKTGCINKVS